MKRRSICAAAMILAALVLSGCAGRNNSEVSSDSQEAEKSAEVTSAATESAVTEPEPESEPESDASVQEPEKTEETSAALEEVLDKDTLIGTWSVISVDGEEFWGWADREGETEQFQVEFTPDKVIITSDGIATEGSYSMTASGVILNNEFEMTYDSQNDQLFIDDGTAYVMKRGENPRPAEISGGDGGMDYIADWVYGVWSTVSVNGEDFWDWADKNGESAEYQMIFSQDGVIVRNEDITSQLEYRITDAGVVVTDGQTSTYMTYDYANDQLTFTSETYTIVMKRGGNPRGGGAGSADPDAEWLQGTWSVITVDGEDYWSMVDQGAQTGQLQIEFTPGRIVSRAGEDLLTEGWYYATTDGTVVVYNETGAYEVKYDSQNDQLYINDGGHDFILKRGENPRPDGQ